MSINFCHIAPVSYLPLVKEYPVHLLLAHLIEENEEYRNFYANLKKENPNVFYHVDNSCFEMFKRGQPMYDSEKLIKMAKLVSGDSIVMSDYPKESSSKTIASSRELAPRIKDAGFQTFFCPQSEFGKIDDLIDSFQWGIDNSDVDVIGVSILACPIGLGINEQTYESGARDESYRLQRYLARFKVFNLLEQQGLLGVNTLKRFHCLGMTDGPNEIELLKPYHDHIFSWDSSSAIWHGINGIQYDQSPTGLRAGKLETEVNFDIGAVDNTKSVTYNMNIINNLCE
ncbi:hypothetical protein UFOVP84_125 [uncultured Caudovirales phage]|uniref:Uncharacterized protein n=1 Tax=uncultured Caudovirales phage TaxID=2100421 RepID=A0A6J5KXY3_9CAUD|nr:hypothetical protein UFOVP84_125 [uncultured Caudovirales phage]